MTTAFPDNNSAVDLFHKATQFKMLDIAAIDEGIGVKMSYKLGSERAWYWDSMSMCLERSEALEMVQKVVASMGFEIEEVFRAYEHGTSPALTIFKTATTALDKATPNHDIPMDKDYAISVLETALEDIAKMVDPEP